MNFFNGLEFVCHGNQSDYGTAFHGRTFAGYYGLQYNHAGKCRLRFDDGEEMTFGAGTVFFTAPGRRYSYGAPEGEVRHHCWVCFQGERVKSFISGGIFNPYMPMPVFRLRRPEKFYKEMLELLNLLRYPAGYRTGSRTHLLEGLLLEIAEQPNVWDNINPHLLNNIDILRQRIADAPQHDWDFEEEARKMAVSYPHFRRLFHRATDFSPTRFLIECRLNAACQLLLESGMPINEIAHRCGYRDEFYFYRLFKQHRFCTASEYRRKFSN